MEKLSVINQLDTRKVMGPGQMASAVIGIASVCMIAEDAPLSDTERQLVATVISRMIDSLMAIQDVLGLHNGTILH